MWTELRLRAAYVPLVLRVALAVISRAWARARWSLALRFWGVGFGLCWFVCAVVLSVGVVGVWRFDPAAVLGCLHFWVCAIGCLGDLCVVLRFGFGVRLWLSLVEVEGSWGEVGCCCFRFSWLVLAVGVVSRGGVLGVWVWL